jgi:hypothetical protein
MFVGGRFYLELIGKFLSDQDAKVETVIKTRQASHGLIMTRQKGHWKNNVQTNNEIPSGIPLSKYSTHGCVKGLWGGCGRRR